MRRFNWLMIVAAGALAALPLLLPLNEAQYSGTDQQAKRLIETGTPQYKPWASPLWTPPSAEMESMLFSLQAALGAGVIGFYFGYRRGRQHRSDRA